MSVLAAPVIALLGLLVGLWWPSMIATAIAVLCGYAAGLLMRFSVRAERYTDRHDTD